MQRFHLTEDAQLVDLGLYLPQHRALAIADIHLGFEEALHQDGTLVPRGHFDQIQARLDEICEELEVSRESPLESVLVNGDLRHRFGPLTHEEWTYARSFLDHLTRVGRQVVILEGNHDLDRSLKALAQRHEGVEVRHECGMGRILFLHGDQEPKRLPSGAEMVVIGHEHPAVGLRDRVTGRVELYKCYLAGPYRGLRLVVQPSFNPWVQGSDLTRERCLSPFLSEASLGEFEIFLVSDERSVYPFGSLRRLFGQPVEQRGTQSGGGESVR